MAEGHQVNKVREVQKLRLSDRPGNLRIHLLNRKEPGVYEGVALSWKCIRWTPEFLATELGELRTRFRVCVRESALGRKRSRNTAVMETDCEFEEATFGEFSEWLKGDVERSGGLSRFERAKYWCYADYKYMAELLADFPHLRQSVDWSHMGFPGRGGDNSTIWIGSAEASTPCHVDTYGCNLVAQIYGAKKWTLFPPSDTCNMSPTRIPYEESSIFSQVNISHPDFKQFPDFLDAVRYEVVLKPGDVLFVPGGWWHYVESLQTSISINTWIELESDHVERVKEAVVRTLVCALKRDEGADEKTWVNPSEDVGTHMQNMDYLQQALTIVRQKASCSLADHGKDDSNINVKDSEGEKEDICEESAFFQTQLSTNDLVNIVTSSNVISAITDQIFKKLRICPTQESLQSNCVENKLQEKGSRIYTPNTNAETRNSDGCTTGQNDCCGLNHASGLPLSCSQDSNLSTCNVGYPEQSSQLESCEENKEGSPVKRRCISYE